MGMVSANTESVIVILDFLEKAVIRKCSVRATVTRTESAFTASVFVMLVFPGTIVVLRRNATTTVATMVYALEKNVYVNLDIQVLTVPSFLLGSNLVRTIVIRMVYARWISAFAILGFLALSVR